MVNKKEYKKPYVKAVKLDSMASILAGSDPQLMRMIDEEPEENQGSDPKPTIWGVQW